jgi:hypothetical protein
MALTWARRQEALLSDCIVSSDVFHHMVDRLGEAKGDASWTAPAIEETHAGPQVWQEEASVICSAAL